jgi:asparagine synthase (glutamine-hydrolysing)
MCGIAGQVDFGGPSGHDAAEAMFATLRCRGPDAHASWTDGIATLGHSRLAIRDLNIGHQPHTTRIGGRERVVVFGGEIYNSRALARELDARGHDLAEASEVCVIAHAHAEWGDDFCTHLVGMFSIAIWSGANRTLTLARDRLGIKPLYFARLGDTALFASEPKGILAHPRCSHRVTADGFNELLAFNLGLPGCPWDDVDEVPPGHTVAVRERSVDGRRYWQLQPTFRPTENHATEVRDLLSEVVADHLASDVPIGVLLSGGLDSTAIAASAVRRLGPGEVGTFSVRLTDSTFVADFERTQPDDAYAMLAARLLGTQHVVIELSAAEVNEPEWRAAAVQAYDVPPGSGDRDRTMAALFATIKPSRSVVLSGEGADELFDGYSWAHDDRYHTAVVFPWVGACQDKYGVEREMLTAGLWDRLGFDEYLAERCLTARRCVPREGSTGAALDPRVEARYHHLTQLLPVLLARKDRLSMRTGLEVRVPYCDHRLVELAGGLPLLVARQPGGEKRLLRDAVAGLVAEPIRRRPKSAYPSAAGAPHVHALVSACRRVLDDRAAPAFELLSRRWLESVAAALASGTTTDVQRVEWALNFVTWIELCSPDFDL